MRTKDWKPTMPAKLLIIGEDSNLQWSDEVPEYVMFADYYFRSFPEDHGERSRSVEARNLFTYIAEVTGKRFKRDEVYITNLCNDSVEPSPKGKRVLIPENKAIKGIEHIKWILSENPTIKFVLAMSLQTNYWLQKMNFYPADEAFLRAAEPRRTGVNSIEPFYQPVDGKAFTTVCGTSHKNEEFGVTVVPILPAKDYPLSDRNLKRYGEAYKDIAKFFE